jgi:sugar/nucleoside kinase (ribokinase family)
MFNPVVFIGHVAKDVKERGSTSLGTHVPGGGVFYGALAFRAFFPAAEVPVLSVLTKVAAADVALFEPLSSTVRTTFLSSPVSTTFENIYPTTNPDDRFSFVHDRALPFTQEDLAASVPSGAVTVISPLWAGEFPESLLPFISSHASLVVADIQGFIRQIVDSKVAVVRPDSLDFLRFIDVLKIDSAECAVLTGLPVESGVPIIQQLLKNPDSVVLCTHKEGVTVSNGTDTYTALFGSYSIIGRTGRGDTCTAAVLACLLAGLPIERVASEAARVTAVKMRSPCPLPPSEQALLQLK